MKYKFFFICLFTALCYSLCAQNDKLRIAVLDPTSSGTGIDEGTKIAVREIISSVFVNTGKYTIVERSLLEKVMNEQKFSNSGAVDDSQASEIGRLAGASKIVLSVIAQSGSNTMLSIKLVDVKLASVEKQKIQVIRAEQLLDFVEHATMELIKDVIVAPVIVSKPVEQQAYNTQQQTTDQQVNSTPQKTVEQQVISTEQNLVEPKDNDNVQTELTELSTQIDSVKVIQNEYLPNLIESKPEYLNVQIKKSNKPTTLFVVGGVSIVAGIAATILLTNDYEEYGYGTKVYGKEYNLIYAGAGLAIGGFCIGKGIHIKKKEKAKLTNIGYYDKPSHSPSNRDILRLDLVAIGNGAGLRFTF